MKNGKTLKQLTDRIHKKHNSNFYWNNVHWPTRVWLAELCEIIDEIRQVKEGEANNAKS
jgi:hypothetical protein